MKISLLKIAIRTGVIGAALLSTISLTSTAHAQAYGTPEYWTQQQANYSRQLQQQQYAQQQANARQQQQQQADYYQQQNNARQKAQQDEYSRQQRESSDRQRADQDRAWRNQNQQVEAQRSYYQRQQEAERTRLQKSNMEMFYWQSNPGMAQDRQATRIWGAISKGYANAKPWGVSGKFGPGTHDLVCSVQFDGIPTGSIQTVWVAVDVKDPKHRLFNTNKPVYRNERFYEHRIDEPAVSSYAPIVCSYDWPKGSYRAEIYMSGKLVLKLPYTIG